MLASDEHSDIYQVYKEMQSIVYWLTSELHTGHGHNEVHQGVLEARHDFAAWRNCHVCGFRKKDVHPWPVDCCW